MNPNALLTYRMVGCLDITEKVHQQTISTPHWCLYTIGVISDSQNNGIGSSLIEPILQVAGILYEVCSKYLFRYGKTPSVFRHFI